MLGFDLTPGNLFLFGPLKGLQLGFSEKLAGFCNKLFKGLEAQLEGLQVMSEPYAANPGG